jgi:two-component system sensor histidine kinase YesM
VIQPFVENSIRNGFREKPPPWKIDVACERVGGRWSITISDNGCGIDETTVRSLREKIAAVQDKAGAPRVPMEQVMDGMAIINTYGRLRLLYGDLLGFEINSSVDGGTTISLSGPLVPVSTQDH